MAVGRLALAALLPALLVALLLPATAAPRPPFVESSDPAALPLPPRAADAPDGSTFGADVAALGDHERYAASAEAILAGNVPAFLRRLVPLTLTRDDDGPGARSVTLFVAPDYLAVGSDDDYLPVPLDFPNAVAVAERLGCALPTPRIVDAIYAAASVRLAPVPLPPGPQMRSMAYILEHRARIALERVAAPLPDRAEPGPAPIVAGTKKDLVLTNRLRDAPDREAIYGWHRPDGRPIQPLSLVHGVHYADYSHGVRLVSEVVLVDGAPRDYADALSDPAVGPLLTREGTIRDAAALGHRSDG